MFNLRIFISESAAEYVRSFVADNRRLIEEESLHVQLVRHLGIDFQRHEESGSTGPGVGLGLHDHKLGETVAMVIDGDSIELNLNGFGGLSGEWILLFRSRLELERVECSYENWSI